MIEAIGVIIVIIIIYKLIENNYKNRLDLINQGMEKLRTNGYTIVDIKSDLYIGTLKTENYETYVSPMSLGFILDNNEILVMPTVHKKSLIIEVSKMDEIDEEKLEELISKN